MQTVTTYSSASLDLADENFCNVNVSENNVSENHRFSPYSHLVSVFPTGRFQGKGSVRGKSDKKNTTQVATTHSAGSLDFPDETFRMFAWNRSIYYPREFMEAFSNCAVNIADNLESWAKKFGVHSGLLHEIPDNVRPYFNYAAWARDALQKGDIWVLDLFDDAIAVFYKKKA